MSQTKSGRFARAIRRVLGIHGSSPSDPLGDLLMALRKEMRGHATMEEAARLAVVLAEHGITSIAQVQQMLNEELDAYDQEANGGGK